ncbi:uncharacterized protein LOC143919277 [Arctopsyche grandis]|uniref:uncharacterized protein LOC143919277 n=1 Tax=Arctopsyche grandis TaxID=121162 RepID=UPI00406D8A92
MYPSPRGVMLLLYRNFIYRSRKKLSAGQERWLCSSKGEISCRAVKFLPTRQGGKYLMVDNFLFTKNSADYFKTWWKCASYNSTRPAATRCKATATTIEDKLTKLKNIHNHDPPRVRLKSDGTCVQIPSDCKQIFPIRPLNPHV